MGRRWGMLFTGLGLGWGAALAVTYWIGITYANAAIAGGIVLAAGLAMLAASGGRSAPDLLEPTPPAPDRPTLSGLGDRVEDILKLAEDQAADHRAEARREAGQILADARAEADRIRAAASGNT